MKKFLIMFMCFIVLTGCTTKHTSERDYEIYEKGYEEGYYDAIEVIIDQMPWYLIDKEEFEDALYKVFDNDEYAEEVRDAILSYCDLYKQNDFRIDYSELWIDYIFD